MTTRTLQKVADGDDEIPETDEMVAMLMTENTGRHMLDSGSAYGRNWEENQGKTVEDFWDEDECEVGIHAGSEGVTVTLNLFHYLAKMLEYNEQAHKLTKQMYLFKQQNDDLYGLNLMEEFTNGMSGNSYNQENILSQVIQTCMFGLEGPTGYIDEREPEDGEVVLDGAYYRPHGGGEIYEMDFIAVQVHGGCDVRGGYTEPVIFKMPDVEYFIMKQRDVYANCERCGERWSSDDAGYHWWNNGGTAGDHHGHEDAFKFVETDSDEYGSDKVVHNEDDGGCGGEVTFYATADY